MNVSDVNVLRLIVLQVYCSRCVVLLRHGEPKFGWHNNSNPYNESHTNNVWSPNSGDTI